MAEAKPREIPTEIAGYLKEWKKFRRWHNSLHVILGGGAIAGSFLAASGIFGKWSSVSATVSGICAAILAFTDPKNKANGYDKAVMVVRAAVRRYRYRQLSLAALFDAVDEGDQLIGASEGNSQVSVGMLRNALHEGRSSVRGASLRHVQDDNEKPSGPPSADADDE